VGPIVLAKYAADIATVGLKKWIRKGWIYLVIAGVAVISYSLFLLALYGSFSPTKLYGSNGQLFMANPFFNLVATLVDRDKGLLLFSPILLIVPLYLYRSFSGARDFCVDIVGRLKKHRAPTTSQFAALGVAIGLLSLLATQLGFADWSGSTSPNGRYYLVFVLFAIFLIAKYINLKNWLELTIVGVVVIFYLFMWKASIISFKNYMTPGVNSFIVDKYPILGHLPVFKIVVQGDSALPSVWQGVRLLGDILVGNILWGWAIVLAGQHRFLARHK
jgi:hypothetical protein